MDGGGVLKGNSVLRVRIFDVVSIARCDGVVAIGSLQQKAFLTLLVANKGRSVTLDAIANELWPDVRPQRWRGCLATLAASLRAAARDRDFVCSTDRGYTLHLRPEAVATDVEDLQRCLEQASEAEAQGRHGAAETQARRALAVYGTGPWTTDLWGWNEAAAEAARILGTALLRRNANVSCITELSRAMEEFDWHDGLWACLIYAHHRLGSTRRACDLAKQARLAIGGTSPILARAEAQLSGSLPANERFAFVFSS